MVSRAAKHSIGNYLFMAAGLDLAAFAAVTLLGQSASADWPTAEGVVTGHDTRPVTVGSKRNKRTHSGMYVTYEYRVDGTRYESDRYAIGQEYTGTKSSGIEASRVMREEYPLREPVDVFYDPDEPDSAVLKRGAPQNNRGTWALGIIGLALFGYCLLQQLGILAPDEE